MFIKTARLGNLPGLSSPETPSSDYGKMSATKIKQLFIKKQTMTNYFF